MAEGEVIGDSFGPRGPPLTTSIKSILGRYPDGGQILKELIQNADDAGATEVKFLYDNRSYGSDSLVSPQLSKFQGPALYSFNNAKFKAEDWESIQNIMESSKKKDQLKIGRFGIGFNSIYHITDLPGIVSGDRVGFLDPHERYFGRGERGQKYKLNLGLLRMRSSDQFAPFHNICGCDLARGKSYNGTLFRFPLRTEPSELSEKEYTKEKITGLFEALRKEASVILLFLNSVQSISVEKRNENGEIECSFKVEIAPATRSDVARKRQELKQHALNPAAIGELTKFIMDVQVSSATAIQTFKWLVVNQIGSTDERIIELSAKLDLLPWVGLVVPLNDEARNAGAGRIFCFLPLPPDCKTGLPVHVHGYFGLTDNRRGLAWAGPDCQNSETAEWNELLLTKIGCNVYCKILEALVEDEPPTGINDESRSQLVYSTLPNLNEVRGHWRSLLKPLFRLLQDQKLFYAQSIHGNSWIPLECGVLDRLQVANSSGDPGVSPETRNAILSTVTQIFAVITNLPSHVLTMVDKQFPQHHQITPHVVRWVIKYKNYDISKANREEKLLLLGYVLSDKQNSELAGLPLLLLANGEFTKFHAHCHTINSSKSVFVPSENCPAALLPNMEDRFLHGDLPDDTAKKLSVVVADDLKKQSPTQLVRLTKEIVLQNMRDSLPREWFRGDEKVHWIPGHPRHPHELWLQEVWSWIFQTSLRNSLKPLEGIPLIPLPSSSIKSLGVLSPNSKYIFTLDGSGIRLPTTIVTFLRACGCTVLPNDLPSELHQSRIDDCIAATRINDYIAAASPTGVLKVISRCGQSVVQKYLMEKCSPIDRSECRSYFCRLPVPVSDHQIEELCQLPLFDTVNGTCTAAAQVNGEMRKAASREFSLPSNFRLSNGEKIISTFKQDHSTLMLLGTMKINVITSADVFIQCLFPDIKKNSVYTAEETDLIMAWVLERMATFANQNKDFLKHMRNLPFVPTKCGRRKMAAELFDPEDTVIFNLFDGETGRFPTGVFATGLMLSRLRELNIGTRDSLGANDLLSCAQTISTTGYSASSLKRAKALVQILNALKHLKKLVKENSETVTVFRSTKFLPIKSKPPDGYFLPWKGSEHKEQFGAPAELFLPGDQDLVGSTCLIVDNSNESLCGNLSLNAKDLLGFSSGRHPELTQVIQQLDIAISTWSKWSDKEKEPKKPMIKSICKRVYEYFEVFIINALQRNKRQQLVQLVKELRRKPWLFIRGEFVRYEFVASSWNGNAAPFLYRLPYEYGDKYKNLVRHVEIKRIFDGSDFIQALYALETLKDGVALTDEELKLTVCLLNELKEVEKDSIQEHVGQIPLPDTQNVLCRSHELTINLTFWIEDPDERYVHQDIPPQLALGLGAKSLQEKRLEPYSSSFGTPFGQNERLTDRLANILKGYPCDSGILKELVQNADDAEATEIHFIHDTRVLPHKRLFLKNAEEIQGPALCVYNNRPFTEKDFDGIQKLGIGSKGNDVEKTGQYGIGFNAVYHLTDCPSILSNGDTLCFLDPECRYVPEATRVFPGRKFKPIDDKFKKDNPDLIPGYLSQYLKVQGATVFRFPLRTLKRSKESLIAQGNATIANFKSLLSSFQRDAKKMLLFLNHIKKICFSVVERSGELVRRYEVSSTLTKGDEKKRKEFSSLIKKYKDKPTNKIPWIENTYPMKIFTSNNSKEKWLIHQCCGVQSGNKDEDIPDGRPHLFPRGGVAALLPSFSSSSVQDERRFVAYCLLPLPCYTSLPVHVNGHFALDTSRRNLWQDEHPNGTLTRWNNFMKSRVLAPGYVTLIQEAQKYIPYCDEDPNEKTRHIFPSEPATRRGLHWYHSLFPDPSIVDKSWEILAIEVYRVLGSTRAPVLPVLVACEAGRDQGVPKKLPHKIQSWLPAQEGFFVSHEITPKDLWTLLMRIGLPLLAYSPPSIYSRLQLAGVTSNLVSPMNVIEFLQTFNCRGSRCNIGELPGKLKNTRIRSIPELKKLITYCMKEESFGNLLTGLPLLLTADGQLRTFDSSNPVYRSQFSDLFPKWTHLFVHPKFVYILNCDDESTQVMRKFTVKELARFLPEIFPANMRGVTEHMPWSFPKNDVMSEEWFRRLWEFLESKKEASLEALREWPIIPTMCRKLVTIDRAKTVLDMSETGTEIARERKVRQFLEKVNSPTLNKAITFKKSKVSYEITDVRHAAETSKTSTRFPKRETAVTDLYVAHPHTVADVLNVLDYMRKTGSLDVSMLPYKEIRELLLFFQDEYENLEPKDIYDKILKGLPLYKTIDDTYVRLSASSSYAIVPGCIPLAEITELQRYTGFLFLHSDALPSLNLLYSALGTGAERTVDSFYVDFILPFFHAFNLDSQMKFLTHIKEKVLPISQKKEKLLKALEETCCIPDEQGHLHHANEFNDPRNEVFRIMLAGSPNKFPPSLFHDDEWLDFLILIGLQEDVNESEFLAFCKEVALANTASKSNMERSKVLVQYLLTSAHLHTLTLLPSVSTIKFIASEKVGDDLLDIHQQYQCREREEPPFVQFQSSVPWKKRFLVWTSAPLLPQWTQPGICSIKKGFRCRLGVLENPTEDSVSEHLRNISCTLAKSAKEGTLPNPDKVKNIMTVIYKFLSTKMTCVSKDLSIQCTKVCKKIGHHLQEIPCVFLEESKVCVKGAQLSFTVPGEDVFNPFLYTVPREYGTYQHFLKRLGATENITPHQLVNILKAMKDQCQEEKMSSDCKKKARIAMYILFELIVDNQALAKKPLLSELYLPSVDELLIKSNQLICKVPSHLDQTVAKLNCNVLLSLDSCGLQRERETDYLNALPENLRPIPLESLVREELEPSCENNTCFSSQDGATCNFIKRYIEIMMCNEFQEGIVRLIKHQQKSNELTDEMMEKCSRLSWINTARVKIKCMSSIKIHLLNKATGTVLEGTCMEHICHVVKGNDSWTLYVRHDFGGKNIRGILSKCVNEIMDNCLEGIYITALTDMLSCNLPNDIADVLDVYDIDKDSSDGMVALPTKNLKQDVEMLKRSEQSALSEELELLDEESGRDGGRGGRGGRGESGGSGGSGGRGGRGGRGGSGGYVIPVHYFPDVDGYKAPNRNEANRWMKQSRSDLQAAKHLLDANPPFNALVCFLSHQIAEKSLKAVLYATRGLTNAQLHTHSVHQLANDVSSEIEVTKNVNMLAALVGGYYLNTRYPNRQPDGRVPAEEFGVAEARTAVEATEKLVEILERFIAE